MYTLFFKVLPGFPLRSFFYSRILFRAPNCMSLLFLNLLQSGTSPPSFLVSRGFDTLEKQWPVTSQTVSQCRLTALFMWSDWASAFGRKEAAEAAARPSQRVSGEAGPPVRLLPRDANSDQGVNAASAGVSAGRTGAPGERLRNYTNTLFSPSGALHAVSVPEGLV